MPRQNGGEMHRTIFGVSFAIAILLLVLSVTAQTGQVASSMQDEFRTLVDRYYAAWNSGNPDNAAPLYAHDADLVFYDLTPLKHTGWAEYDAGVRKVLASFASARFTPQSDLRVTRRGLIAWTTV